MFVHWHDDCVRLTGRWSRLTKSPQNPKSYVQPPFLAATTTAPGSYFELAFEGDCARLHFDLGFLAQPFPHLWISVDDGARVEVPVDRYLRVETEAYGKHVIRVIYKGGMEMLPRWYAPLMGAVAFIGAEVDAPAELPADDRMLIEFVGDSITEGVLTDADYSKRPAHTIDQHCRVYQDDNCATYAYLTAKKLNLRAMFQAYGAVGLTRSGCGSVPRAGLIYPYVFDGLEYTGEKPAVVVINHGANDRAASDEEYIARYSELIDIIRERNPEAVIVCLGAFCGAFDEAIGKFAEAYNASHEKKIHFVSTKGWIPLDPLHPLRDGHRIVAQNFAPILEKIIKG